MASNTEIIKRHLEQWKTELLDEYDKRNFRASGQFERDLETIATENTGVILSSKHIVWMNRGRGPTTTTSAGSPTLREIIEKWTINKGIAPRPGQTRKSLAFAIAKKIHERGYSVQGREGIVEDVITDDKIDNLFAELTGFNQGEFFGEIRQLFEDIKTA